MPIQIEIQGISNDGQHEQKANAIPNESRVKKRQTDNGDEQQYKQGHV
ncbi:hypothetical protein D515_01079 [Grimontia indica]|uniref:Uncharacterized protein n=1 Tax=Grimontia indica TaxID=1056512 RepID=R1IGZ3_9GAMM|nr:hypothetical protein D515_01079 [Grimontia indica]